MYSSSKHILAAMELQILSRSVIEATTSSAAALKPLRPTVKQSFHVPVLDTASAGLEYLAVKCFLIFAIFSKHRTVVAGKIFSGSPHRLLTVPYHEILLKPDAKP